MTEQQLLALKGQQEAAHELQLAEVAKKEKAAADAHASAEAEKQAAAETALRLEEKRVDLESMIKNLQKQATMLRSEEQKANAKYYKLKKSDVAETASEEHAKAIAAAEETKDELDTTNAINIQQIANLAPRKRTSEQPRQETWMVDYGSKQHSRHRILGALMRIAMIRLAHRRDTSARRSWSGWSSVLATKKKTDHRLCDERTKMIEPWHS